MQTDASNEASRLQQAENNRLNQREVDTESLLESSAGNDVQSTLLSNGGGTSLDDIILGRGTTLLGGRS